MCQSGSPSLHAQTFAFSLWASHCWCTFSSLPVLPPRLFLLYPCLFPCWICGKGWPLSWIHFVCSISRGMGDPHSKHWLHSSSCADAVVCRPTLSAVLMKQLSLTKNKGEEGGEGQRWVLCSWLIQIILLIWFTEQHAKPVSCLRSLNISLGELVSCYHLVLPTHWDNFQLCS